MEKQAKRITFEEFANHLVEIFDEVIRDHETIFIESKNGGLIEVKPAAPAHQNKMQEDKEAFLASAGAWADVDVESFLKANEESRKLNTRPPVDL